ncbi:MAG: YidC/Oxa1 family membrane protein insertase [Eubacteriales bacterium]|nr:YidC/Oxa1 family membrane protein insertase [Eubacteriales bacterium]
MELATVSMFSIFDPLYLAFGWTMRMMYNTLDNYGLVIIVFTVILRGLMIPLGIHQQKSTIKQQSLQGEIAEIQRLYPNDKAKQSELQMALYKKHGASPVAGCLPAILQLLIIWPIFQIMRAPLQYIMNVSKENLTGIGSLLETAGLITATEAKNATGNNIPLMNALHQNAAALGQVVDKGLMELRQLIDVNFMGINLGLTPSWKPADLFGAGMIQYLPLLIFPVLVVLTTMLSMKITTATMPNRKKKAEDKEREKKNPARTGQTPEDKTESMMKSMNIMMPLFMLWTTFTMPAALGLYWIIGNIMAAIQSLIIYMLYTRKLEDKKHGAHG